MRRHRQAFLCLQFLLAHFSMHALLLKASQWELVVFSLTGRDGSILVTVQKTVSNHQDDC